MAGDFNAGKLKSVLPHFYQHVTCATRGDTPLDHLYSTYRNTYRTLDHKNQANTDTLTQTG